jgi:hypothetical protein
MFLFQSLNVIYVGVSVIPNSKETTMKKNTFKMTLVSLISVLTLINCPKEKKDDNTAAMALLLMAQQSGPSHCASITKNADNNFSASIAADIGQCNVNSGNRQTDMERSKSSSKNFYSSMKAIYDRYPTECAANILSIQTMINGIDSWTVNTFCGGGSPSASCATEEAWQTFVNTQNGTGNNSRRLVKVDANAVAKNSLVAAAATLLLTTEQQSKFAVGGADIFYAEFAGQFASAVPSCFAKIKEAYPNIVTLETDSTKRQQIAFPVTSSINCRYGSASSGLTTLCNSEITTW